MKDTEAQRCRRCALTDRPALDDAAAASVDWSAWHIYFGDERCLPAGDAARNSRMAGEDWLEHVSIPVT